MTRAEKTRRRCGCPTGPPVDHFAESWTVKDRSAVPFCGCMAAIDSRVERPTRQRVSFDPVDIIRRLQAKQAHNDT